MRIRKAKFIKKIVIFLLSLLIVVGVVGYFALYLPYTRIRAKGMILVASAKEMKSVFSQNNIDLLNDKYVDFTKKYKDFETEAETVYWLAFIPHVKDFKSGVEAGNYLIDAGRESLTAITPYADLIGFKKGSTSFVERSAEDRLQTAVATLDKVLSKIDRVSEDIKQAEARIQSIDPKRYPEKIGTYEVRGTIQKMTEEFHGISSLFVDAKPLLKNLPVMLGKDKEKTYLLLFQNDKERRATGGFLTAYAVFKIKDGKIHIDRSADIYSLDNSISVHPPAPREILTFHKGVTQFYIRDSNLSPDFPKSIELFNSLYQKSGEKVNYDGIVALDSKILVDMLTIFGDTEADGVRFSSKIDKRCDCPQVLYQLFDMVDRPVGYIRENRKGILGELMYQLFYKALGFSPSRYWGTLAQTMFKNLDEKHILLYFKDPDLQQSVEKLNYAGRIKEYKGDYLHINNVNFAGAKSNLFVSERINSVTTFEGNVKRDVRIEFRNPYPPSDCNLERGGLCLNATLRNWIRVYVPQGSKLIEFKGVSKQSTYDELGKTVFEGFLTVDPMGKADASVRYTLPSTITKDNYSLLIQKQAGTDGQQLKVQVDGAKKFDGIFAIDKEIRM
ncbi:MAG: DUF4012 domain-containing protein [bacterium]|nr:DUF4012 domain-containing protein [bacterium]